MLKKIVFAFVIFAFIVLVVTMAVLMQGRSTILPVPMVSDKLPKTAILFYSEQCPHCRDVEAFIKNRGGMTHYGITQKKIGPAMSKRDESLLLGVVKACKMNPNQIFIPLLWDGKRCVTGDKDVINYLKKKN